MGLPEKLVQVPVGSAPEVQPVGYNGEGAPQRLFREAQAAYARQPSYIARLKRRRHGKMGRGYTQIRVLS